MSSRIKKLMSSAEFPALPGSTPTGKAKSAPPPEIEVRPERSSSALSAAAHEFRPNSAPPPALGSVTPEEIQRVRKQIEDMADQLKEAFAKEKYEDVKLIGEKKKELEEKLKKFEEQYSNDKVLHELQDVKEQISKVDDEMKAAFESESYAEVAELGRKKKELQSKLADLESNFGLHNAVYQVGDRVSVIGLKSPRGGTYNGLEGTVTEYNSQSGKYSVRLNEEGEKHVSVGCDQLASRKALSRRASAEAKVGQSQTRQLIGEIKLWFPRKHFGFIMPDNKPEDEPDIFFHGTHVENRKDMPIKRFARVKFSVIPAPKGPQARDVTINSYQPEKEKAADEAEAAKQAAEGTKPTRARDEDFKKKKRRRKRKAAADAEDGPPSRGSNFHHDINIEDSLDHVSPANFGFSGTDMTRHPSTRTDELPSWKAKAARNAPQQRQAALRGSIQKLKESRASLKDSRGSPKLSRRTRNREAHKNWGSISSALGSMHWDESINSFSTGKNATDAANRPKMSIQGSGPARRSKEVQIRQSLRSMKDAQKMLEAILAEKEAANRNANRAAVRRSMPEMRPRRATDLEPRRSVGSLDMSRNHALDLRRSTGSNGSSSRAVQDALEAQGKDLPRKGSCSNKVSL